MKVKGKTNFAPLGLVPYNSFSQVDDLLGMVNASQPQSYRVGTNQSTLNWGEGGGIGDDTIFLRRAKLRVIVAKRNKPLCGRN